MGKATFCTFFVYCLIVLAVLAPGYAAAAQMARSPDDFCAGDRAKVYRFDQGLGADWTVSQRPMKSAAAPYPDGSIDGDTGADVRARGGVLHLTSRRAGAGFTGSRILSRQLVRYGCVEFVARLPRGRGYWPALWLRTPYDGTPINGEIDMLEGFGSHPGVFVSTLHHWRAGVDRRFTCARVVEDAPRSPGATALALAAAKLAGTERSTLGNWLFANYQNPCAIFTVAGGADFAAGFHRYLLVWTPDRLIWALDGHPFFETSDDIPQVGMMIVLGLGMGAMDGGPDGATPAFGDFQIESVRLMQLKHAASSRLTDAAAAGNNR